MKQLTFDFPNLPKGAEIDITGFDGYFKNGETRVLTDEEVVRFEEVQADMLKLEDGTTLEERFKDNSNVKIAEYVPPKKKKEGDE